MSATFSRWAYAKYGPKTFGLGESGDGAFFKITCIYGAADDEEPRAAMNFIREARLVSHQTGKSPSELAASLADAQAEIARLRDALERAISFVRHAEVSSGVCCCGDSIVGHGNPMNCGHSPRDMWDYASEGFINEMQALLK